MAKVSLSALFKKRRRIRYVTAVASLAVIAILVQLLIFDRPEQTKAGVSYTSSSAVSISGPTNDRYVIDSDGYVYAVPFNKISGVSDWRYFSYLATKVDCTIGVTTEHCNVKDKSLTVNNAEVAMEGTQDLANLTIQGGGRVTQPVADRAGYINKPIYAQDYWVTRFTGYVRLDGGYLNWFRDNFDNSQLDNAILIEIGAETPTGGMLNPVRSCTNESLFDNAKCTWMPLYARKSGVLIPTWHADLNTEVPAGYAYAGFSAAMKSLITGFLSNDTGNPPKYVPIRFTFGETTGQALMSLRHYKWITATGGGNDPTSGGSLSTDLLYNYYESGVNRGKVDTASQGKMHLEYATDFASNQISDDIDSNGVITFQDDSVDLDTDFLNNFGDTNAASSTFDYSYGNGGLTEQYVTPIGHTWANRDVYMAPRHSEQSLAPRNLALMPTTAANWPSFFKTNNGSGTTRRIRGGLTLNITGTLNVTGSGSRIDVDGAGYPGWGNEFVVNGNSYNGFGGGGPGGGISNSGGCNVNGSNASGGGGWHARQGGEPYNYQSCSSSTNVPVFYGDDSEYIDQEEAFGMSVYLTALGSGGGASANDEDDINLGGAGGGAVKINARQVDLSTANSITADGVPGKSYFSGTGGTGGAGGKVVVITETLNMTTTYANITSVGGAIPNPNTQYNSFSAGSGGFIVIVYGQTNVADIKADYDLHCAVDGGSTTSGINHYGKNGVVSVSQRFHPVNDESGVGIKKTLDPISRPYNANPKISGFNPYALQINDQIRVNIEASNLTIGTPVKIVDEVLKLPNDSENRNCEYVAGSALPADATVTIDPPASANPNKITWDFTPTAANTVNNSKTFSYECIVKKH